MRFRTLKFAAIALLAALAGCSGGSSSNVKLAECGNVSSFCLVGCNLGCSQIGCSITEIAQNQPIQLNFNRLVDPASVNTASVSIQTTSGQRPNGRLLVNGSTIVFEPSLRVVGGVTLFGFEQGQTYLFSLPGGPDEAQSVRSVSGDRLPAPISCTLTVSRGIIDLDGQPPQGTLIAPGQTTDVPRDATIVVEFSEIIDTQPFQGGTTANSPIEYRVSLSETDPQTGELVCDQDAARVFVPGVPQTVTDPNTRRTQVILKPSSLLPWGACLEVEITNRVTDLAGTAAVPITFELTVQDKPREEIALEEAFDDDSQLDTEFSSGTWDAGEAMPGKIGEDGILGDFDITNGRSLGGGVWEWSTDSQLIPGTQTFTGQDITVTDGVFRFSRFHLPDGTTLKFVGSNPPRFIVRGSVVIDGVIDLSAVPQPEHMLQVSGMPNPDGQPGGPGAVFGGAGGDGGDMGDGMSALPEFDGQDGEDVQLIAGHAYEGGPPTGRQQGTGGKGSLQHPEDGLSVGGPTGTGSVTFNGSAGLFCAQISAGGGGGGNSTAGQNGTVVRTTCSPSCPGQDEGPDAPGGSRFDLMPVPMSTPPLTRLDHFLVGGSGGGGGGSHPFFSTTTLIIWKSGSGGAGGGGAIAFRVGGDARMNPGSEIRVQGGSCPSNSLAPPPSPGGGGSGGSCILQVGGTPDLRGSIDARGGLGGFSINPSATFLFEIRGGDGGPGVILLENGDTKPPVSALGFTQPMAQPQNVEALTETDTVVGCQSLWYPTDEFLPPPVVRYELIAEEDGQEVTYSDDPSVGILAAGSTPVQLWLQAAKIDPGTGVIDEATIQPWRLYAGPDTVTMERSLFDDFAQIAEQSRTAHSTAFRFLILFDRSVKTDIVVKDLQIVYTEGNQ